MHSDVNEFSAKIYGFIDTIPKGKVVSYSQVAAICGKPGAARVVGQIAHFGPHSLPWHRLLRADGSMAGGYVPGGPDRQAELLAQEGIIITNSKVDMVIYQWK